MIVSAENIACVRGDLPLFQGLSLRLDPGELLHVKGPNGVGKSSLLRIIAGLRPPTLGRVTLGIQHSDIRVLGHQNGLWPDLSVTANIDRLRSLFPIEPRTLSIYLQRYGQTPLLNLPCRVLSAGQQRRLILAILLAAQKPLYILDEPFVGLDHHSCHMLLEDLQTLRQKGSAILLTSHQDFDFAGHGTLSLAPMSPPQIGGQDV